MSFFFEEASPKRKGGKKNIPLNSARQLECKVCPLNAAQVMSPKMQPQGSEKAEVYILGGHPTKNQDEQGDFFGGVSGEYFLNRIPQNWDSKIRANWTVRCHPYDKKVDEVTLECCKNSIVTDILKHKPKVIIAVDWEPLRWLIRETRIDLWRGRLVPIRVKDHTCWMYPIYSPTLVISKRRKDKKSGKYTKRTEWDTEFERDLDYIFNLLDKNKLGTPKVYTKDLQKNIYWTEGNQSEAELEKVLGWLKEAENWGDHANDIETTALRPYWDDSRIITISIGIFDKTYAFPYDYRRNNKPAWTSSQLKRLRKAYKRYLLKSGKKICHNTKFEQEWYAYFFGLEILRETEWADSQASAYTINEKRGLHSLDKLCLLYFGFNLKTLSNLDRKRMESYPLSRILPYNGLDVKWTHKLYEAMRPIIEDDKNLKSVEQRLLRMLPTLVCAQYEGLDIDLDCKEKLSSDMQKEIDRVVSEFRALSEVRKYRDKFGKSLQISSPNDLLKFFLNVMGFDDELKNKKGEYGTDEGILKKLDIPIANLILEYRGIAKKKSTYVDSLDGVICPDGKIHTNYNPYETSTGRLSSDDPNMQNWPNRKGREIRKMVVAPPDHWIVCSDYGQIEARLLGVASQDPVFCDALWNDYDVHLEWAEKIINECPDILDRASYRDLEHKIALKKFRGVVKNQWVFPAFYGSSPFSIANSLGIESSSVFKLFDEFWSTFRGVKAWQNWIKDFYNKHGYVETLTGRRRHGPLSFNEAVNAPIQGTASDICVDAMNRMSEYGYKVVMNVHDDVTSIVHDDDLDDAIEHIPELMCEVPFSWINVPIAVEVTVGADWETQEEIGTFKSTNYHRVDKELYKIGHYAQY